MSRKWDELNLKPLAHAFASQEYASETVPDTQSLLESTVRGGSNIVTGRCGSVIQGGFLWSPDICYVPCLRRWIMQTLKRGLWRLKVKTQAAFAHFSHPDVGCQTSNSDKGIDKLSSCLCQPLSDHTDQFLYGKSGGEIRIILRFTLKIL